MEEHMDRCRAVISLDAIRNNYAALRRAFPNQKIMSVLKADAYGHGISGIGALCNAYTDAFAVAEVEEGRRLREAGAKKPILVLGPVPEGQIARAARLGLTFSVGGPEYAEKLQRMLVPEGLIADCQLKLDTGFNRTGYRCRWEDRDRPDFLQDALALFRMENLRVTGCYTHLPVPESEKAEDIAFTDRQLDAFRAGLDAIRTAGYDPGVTHALSTGGAQARKQDSFDMIRVGMPVYGQCDTPEHYASLGLRQALRWSAEISALRSVPKGESVGYGRLFRAERDTLVGVVSAGYADGYRRCYQGLTVLCGGKRVPILGRICMDFMMVDLTDLPDPKVGMEVVLLGSAGPGGEELTAMEIAAARDSTCGEVTAAITARVPRYYV